MLNNTPTTIALIQELLTTAQAAKLCGLGERTFWRHAHSGVAPAPVRIGGSAQIPTRGPAGVDRRPAALVATEGQPMSRILDMAAGEQAAAVPGVRKARLVPVRGRCEQSRGGNLRPDRIAQAVRGRRLACTSCATMARRGRLGCGGSIQRGRPH